MMKKNILIISNYYPEPKIGGIERVTFFLFKYLKKNGFFIINVRLNNSIYDNTYDFILSEYVPYGRHMYQQIEKIVNNYNINIIINQSLFFITPILRRLKQIKIITVFHNCPYFIPLSLGDAKKLTFGWKRIILPYIYFLYKKLSIQKLKKTHRLSYLNSDITVLLSNSYIEDYCKILNIDGKKIRVINNPLSYEKTEQPAILKNKENIVLVVSRLYEEQKRISLILKIWEKIEKQMPYWDLIIIGDGVDKDYYISMSSDLNLHNIKFLKAQSPISYYKKASIFLMTSKMEGWPLTILESLQNGVVPIIMNSFSAVHDIIENGYNGILVDNNNIEDFTNKTLDLMANFNKRQQMALNGLISCKKYAPNIIIDKWINLINEVNGK